MHITKNNISASFLKRIEMYCYNCQQKMLVDYPSQCPGLESKFYFIFLYYVFNIIE